jgi:hypothetical protein
VPFEDELVSSRPSPAPQRVVALEIPTDALEKVLGWEVDDDIAGFPADFGFEVPSSNMEEKEAPHSAPECLAASEAELPREATAFDPGECSLCDASFSSLFYPHSSPCTVPLPDAVTSAALSSSEDWVAYLTLQVMSADCLCSPLEVNVPAYSNTCERFGSSCRRPSYMYPPPACLCGG